MQLHQLGNGRVTLPAHVKALFIATIMKLYLCGIFSRVPRCGCGTARCVHRDLKWPNVLKMCCKFFHGLLHCRHRDINIAANHAFTRDFSHSRGPRQREHLDWISDVTGKGAEEFGQTLGKCAGSYLRERVRVGGLGATCCGNVSSINRVLNIS